MDFDDNGEEITLPPLDPTAGNSARPKPAGGGSPDLAPGNCTRNGGARYRECLKNHAVGIGGHAVDGCGEFMPAGDDTLRCAACACHRNFHRKDADYSGEFSPPAPAPYTQYYRSPAGYLQYHSHHPPAAAPPRPVAALAYTSTSVRDEYEDFAGGGGSGGGAAAGGGGKKRFRTKFSPEQKGKMLAFAERVGWRVQKHDEEELRSFCEENGVKRHVFKVWMHNNKHNVGKQGGGAPQSPHPSPPARH